MRYKKVVTGVFVNRPNRFVANVLIDGTLHTVHVKNTGRCKELLVEGATVYLSHEDGQNRKTEYDLIAVKKVIDENESILINMDSQIVNDVVEEWLCEKNIFGENAFIKREVTYKNSRFDFYVEHNGRSCFLEVKGVTLENNKIASFPDAPTIRGIKHIKELCHCISDGYDAYIVFVIQMSGMKKFIPNGIIHRDFACELKKALDAGVKIICVECDIKPDEIYITDLIPFEI